MPAQYENYLVAATGWGIADDEFCRYVKENAPLYPRSEVKCVKTTSNIYNIPQEETNTIKRRPIHTNKRER